MKSTPMDEQAETRLRLARSHRSGRIRWWLGLLTVVLAVGLPWLLLTGLPAAERTYAGIAAPTQMLVSIVVPCIAIVFVHDRTSFIAGLGLVPSRLAIMAVKVAAWSAAIGALGSAVAAIAAGVGGVDPWPGVAVVAIGGVLVQAGAGLVGFALGLLFGSPWLACPATVVLPLGLWFVLGTADGLAPARSWITPFGAGQNLLAGEAVGLAQWPVVAVLWGVGLSTLGVLLLRRREA
ncbi:MAG: hypothetical protein ACRD0P_16055 [Stackebrandtia sp.]